MSITTKLTEALDYHFGYHRVVFWYDDEGRYQDLFESYQVPQEGLKIKIENNEFELRYRINREYFDRKILVYSPKPKPEDKENWLLDLTLSNFLFLSNKSTLVLRELSLDDTFLPLIQEYSPFFQDHADRITDLSHILKPEKEDPYSFRIAMLSILCGKTREEMKIRREFPEIMLSVILDTILDEGIGIWKSIESSKLDNFFWEACCIETGYENDEPTIAGLVHHLFKTALDFQLGSNQSNNAGAIYSRIDLWRKHQDWRDRVQNLIDFEENQLNVVNQLSLISSIDTLIKIDIFKEADRCIINLLLKGLLENQVDPKRALEILEKRRETYWYRSGNSERLVFYYKTLYCYLLFFEALEQFNPSFEKINDIWKAYAKDLFNLDGNYRRFLHALYETESSSTFAPLLDKLESLYTERYLQVLAEQWQTVIDQKNSFGELQVPRIGSFFRIYIEPYLLKDRSVFVIISDGLRYDIGHELAGYLSGLNRFSVTIDSMIATIPSITSLGMASLLPHRELSMCDDGNTVLADGMSTVGIENREKVIQTWIDKNFKGKTVKAIKADLFMDMPRTEQTDFIRGVDLIFLYSSGVDAIGDDVKTELRLPRAADDEIRKLVNLCQHIGNNLSRTHIVITADHGFLFRYKSIPDTERANIVAGEGEVRRDFRFILSRNPIAHPSADIINPADLGRNDPFMIQTARGVSCFRRPGGGTRYVHGGRMLQELCIPVLVIRRTRTDDISGVDIAVIDRQDRITTGQISVTLLQEQPSGPKATAREIDAVFEGEEGEKISDTLHLIFDSTDLMDQNRTRKVTFHFLKAADQNNGKRVRLVLYEVKSGGIRVFYKEYIYHFQKKLQMDINF